MAGMVVETVAGMVVETAAGMVVETAAGMVVETAAATAVETETVVGMVVATVVAPAGTVAPPPVMVAGMASPEQAGPERDTANVSDMDTREADRVTDTDTEKHRRTA